MSACFACAGGAFACTGTRESAAPARAPRPPDHVVAHAADVATPNAGPDLKPTQHSDSLPLSAAVVEQAAASTTQATEGAKVAAADSGNSASAVLALDESVSTSQGGPSTGHVLGAVAIPDSGPGFFHNTKRPREARFGTVELVQAIVRAAAAVERDLPGSALTVNDLGLESGGPIRQHGSHQAGRDADILFYMLDAHGQPVPAVGVPIDPQGKGIDFNDLSVPGDDVPERLDTARTWHFVAALLENADDAVQRIFIVEHVRNMLLAEAKRVHAPKPIIQRFDDITCQPQAPHDDHMHVRLYCTPQDLALGCQDSLPTYPWRLQQLQSLGLRPAIASAARSKAEREATAERTTTPAEARKKAGPMHAKVVQFLAERQAWIKPPRPGRTYCR